MNEVRPRAMGTEMEWYVGLRYSHSKGNVQADKELYDMAKLAVNLENYHGQYLANGARCYKDSSFLEYATGEEDTVEGTVASEIAGERIIENIAREYSNRNKKDIIGYEVLKRVYFRYSISSGYHINLCGDATKFKINEKDLYDLALWAATAPMYTGAGGLNQLSQDGNLRPTIGQKTAEVTCGFSWKTTGFHKPLICTRDEPHGNYKKFHRVQIVGLDPNISPWASRMALGTASLCLRAIEQNKRTGYVLQRQPTRSGQQAFAALARNVSFNTNLDTIVTLQDDKTISAVDLQRELMTNAAATEHTDEEATILKEWERILDDIEGDRVLLKQKSGWYRRLDYLQRYADRHDMQINDKKMMRIDKSWDKAGQGTVAEKLRNTVWKDDMPSEQLILHRINNPNPNTRASFRSEAIRASSPERKVTINWESYKFEEEKSWTYCSDPLSPTETLAPPAPPYPTYFLHSDEEDYDEYDA